MTYGAKEQLTPEEYKSPPLYNEGNKRIQGIVGSLLYYASAVDNNLLVSLSDIGAQQASATERMNKAINHLLDYMPHTPPMGSYIAPEI